MPEEYILDDGFAAPVRQIDYAAELNEQQLAAVTAVGSEGPINTGPMLVIAGAGSGKTRTLTYRVAWLVENGIPPGRILLLTFTNKASREMLKRVAGLMPVDISAIWGGTFHHIGNRILRRHARLIGYETDFTILDRDDQKDLLDACLLKAKIETSGDQFPKSGVLSEIFSLAVNTERSLGKVLAEQYEYFEPLVDRIAEVQQMYEERKRQANVMDYDDLLVKTVQLMRDHPEVGDRYRDQFLHVLVDEYQDTNRIQAELIDALSMKHKNLMVVGDDAQSIYSWRGADFRNILGFPERYPGARTFKIEVNYRSLPPVLALANDAIRGNVRQFPKTLQPVREGGMKPWLIACADSNQQALFVAQRIMELRDEGVSLNDIAVLYRAHFHAMEIQMELTRRQVPYVITSGLRFFEQAHIKDVSCFLKVTLNPNDEISFKRIMQLMAGVGGATAEKMWREFHPVLAEITLGEQRHGALLPETSPAVPKKAAAAWKQVATVLNELRAMKAPLRADLMIEVVTHGYYEDYLRAKYPNARVRMEDLRQLSAFGVQFQTVDEFLSQLALLTNLEADDASLLSSEEQEYVRLSTVHQAKGQEWKAVLVVGLCDGMFPLARAVEDNNREGEEEERRLFYVAVTRAKDELYMTYPQYRAMAGDAGGFQRPSRFLSDLSKEHYQELTLKAPTPRW